MQYIVLLYIILVILVPFSASAEPYDMRQALVDVYRLHPELEAAREQLKATDQNVPEALGGFLPSVNAGYSRGRRGLATGNAQRSYFDTQSKSISFEQPLYRGGSSWASYQRAHAEVRAGRANLVLVEQELFLDTVVAYTELATACRQLMISKNHVDALIGQLKGTQKRFDVGDATRSDVAQAGSRLAFAESRLEEAITDLHAAKAMFVRLTGKPVKLPVAMPVRYGNIPDNLELALQLAESHSPLLVLSELDVQTTDYARKEQTGTLLPQVSLIGSADNSFSSAVNSSKIDDRRLLVNVDIPLYEGGSRYARIRAAKHRNRQARFNVLDARRGITEEVTRLWRQLGASGVIIESITHAVSSSQESLDSVITEQQHGTRTVLDVLDAQRELFDARTALVNARRDEVIRSYRLLAAMGLLSAETLALVDDPYDPAAHFRKVEWQVIGF